MLTCAGCGKQLTLGRYLTTKGQTWHPNCFRCSICLQLISGSYATGYWGERYCWQHETEFPHCFSCDRLICEALTQGGAPYADGRQMCNLCRKTAVIKIADGYRLLQPVRATLRKLGIDFGLTIIPLRITYWAELKKLGSNSYASAPVGMASHRLWTQNGQAKRREITQLTVLYGLPAEHFSAIAAHELMHVWLFLNEFPKLSPKVEEGLCELISYLWLREQVTPEASYRMRLVEQRQDPLYGAGFQAAKQALDTCSLQVLLDRVRQSGNFN